MKTISTANHASTRKLKEGRSAELITSHLPARRAVVPRPRDEGSSRKGGFLNLHRFLVRRSLGEGGLDRRSFSEGGFLNLRVLFGLFVGLTGVFLALVSFGPATTGLAQGTTREEMTLTLAQALNLPQPPACVAGQEMFNDVLASNPFCPYIEELARLGIAGGCGGSNYCPGDPVTRQQMAAFLVKALMAGNLKFTDLTLKNGWVGNCFRGGVPQVALGLDGTVHLRGEMCRASGNSMNPFQLPANVRPSVRVWLTANQATATTGRIVINDLDIDGEVTVEDDFDHAGVGAMFTSLAGITYNP